MGKIIKHVIGFFGTPTELFIHEDIKADPTMVQGYCLCHTCLSANGIEPCKHLAAIHAVSKEHAVILPCIACADYKPQIRANEG